MSDRKNVLFLCTGNSARSILGEALANARPDLRTRLRGFSAGSHPRGKVNPHALAWLTRTGVSTAGLRSKRWDEFAAPDAPRMDLVITVCDQAAGESCPLWPGHPLTAHWGMPDPAAVEGDDTRIRKAFDEAAATLERRLRRLVELRLDNTDTAMLRQQLSDIGKS